MSKFTIGSLFDGSGTAPLAATILGMMPLWASEIEPFPIAVTKTRFPNTKHLGDITQINGADIEPVNIIVGGSPCTDLSIAGKQLGLQDGKQSHLFYEMTRIVREMREATHDAYPRFVLWENVPGAFSSNKGEDFRAVVEEFCRIADSTVHIARPAKWRNAGTVVGNEWSFAWRVIDAKHWGVPQRRRRIYAILDLGSERAGEILFERTGLPWNTESCGETGQSTPADAMGCANRGTGVRCLNPNDPQTMRVYDADGIYPAITANSSGGQNRQAVIYSAGAFCAGAAPAAGSIGYSEQVAPTLKAGQCAFPMGAVVYPVGAVGSICARADSSPCIDRGQPFVAYGIDCRNGALNEEITPTMQAKESGGQSLNYMPPVLYDACCSGDGKYPSESCITDYTNVICMESAQANAAIVQGISPCLNASHEQPILCCNSSRDDVAGTLDSSYFKGTGARNGQEREIIAMATYQNTGRGWWNGEEVAQTLRTPCGGDSTKANLVVEKHRRYIVRRLTPTECSRLQGFPDWWLNGIAVLDPTEKDVEFWTDVWETYRKVTNPEGKPKTRKQIVKWLRDPGSDSNKYKMWGNGMALPCMFAVINAINNSVTVPCAVRVLD